MTRHRWWWLRSASRLPSMHRHGFHTKQAWIHTVLEIRESGLKKGP